MFFFGFLGGFYLLAKAGVLIKTLSFYTRDFALAKNLLALTPCP